MSTKNDRFIIQGGAKLSGSIEVVGAKNAALKALVAALLLDGESIIENVPQIEDIDRLMDIIEDLGVVIERSGSMIKFVDPTIKKNEISPVLHQKTRSSILLAVPILLQHKKVTFSYPGGCIIGNRPVDFFIEGYKKFGIQVTDLPNGYSLDGSVLHAGKVVFTRASVTGTESMMMLASRIPGTSQIINAAMEPEIVALAEFLNSCGANISGAGSSVITIQGSDKLSGGVYKTIPDRIEAGTFAILAAATNSEITIKNIVPSHMEIFWQLLSQAGVDFQLTENSVTIRPSLSNLKAIPKDIITHEYPGFPTDLQAPMAVLMTQAKGQSLIFETIYEGRLFYIDKLNSMGANIFMADPHRVMITGPTKLVGRSISSPDIRAGMAMVIAGLIAEGQTEIDNIYQIDRGYENIEKRLQTLGADIKRISE